MDFWQNLIQIKHFYNIKKDPLAKQNIPKAAPKEMPDGELIRPNFEDLYPFLSDEEIKNNMLT